MTSSDKSVKPTVAGMITMELPHIQLICEAISYCYRRVLLMLLLISKRKKCLFHPGTFFYQLVTPDTFATNPFIKSDMAPTNVECEQISLASQIRPHYEDRILLHRLYRV